MSDFLDRLAARAIGGETALAPRLPSLFEPLQRTPIVSLAEEGETPSRHSAAATPAAPAAVPAPSTPLDMLAQQTVGRAMPVDSIPASAAVATPLPRDATRPSPVASAPVPPPAVERAVAPSAATSPVGALPSSPVPPRQTRITVDRHEPLPPPSSGSLLSTPTLVFSTSPGVPAPVRPSTGAARHARATPIGARSETASEPVVHVSIGRLEVRAPPAPAAPTRHREQPRPGSLDDYLRQRGKASP